jgi:adenosylcobyric acid synthase
VHGVFDGAGAARKVVDILAGVKGVKLQPSAAETDAGAYKEAQYDMLAETLRRHMDMKKVYEILEQGAEPVR